MEAISTDSAGTSRLEAIRETESTERSSDSSTQAYSEITPLRLDERFRIVDNPTFRFEPTDTDNPTPTSSPSARNPPVPIEPQNPYQFHRYNFFRSRWTVNPKLVCYIDSVFKEHNNEYY